MDALTRAVELARNRALMEEVVDVNEAVRCEAVRLRTSAAVRVAAMDALIAATASHQNATLVHRDPHFAAIPANLLTQEILSAK
ncbi:MAG: type II toxin-antitoxin system VapC family toxin [Verrucomicrobia bacterium]|nr:type II toxin-antitoxin system VapC family toxin [Verrucomicrobiota bacterium]